MTTQSRESEQAKRRSLRAVATALAVSLLAASASGAAEQKPENSPDSNPGPVTQDYKLGPGDLLSINVIGLEKSQGRISNSGKIHVPHLGIMRVYDMTVPELQAAIAQKFVEQDLLKDPWVQIQILQPRARPVYILGEVLMPGQFLIKDEMHLTDLITLGGGFNEFATPVGYLYRRTAVTGEKDKKDKKDKGTDDATSTKWSDEVINVDFEKLMSGEDAGANLELQGGDVLYVPQRRQLHFYVVGDVGKPGVFEYPQRGANSPKNGDFIVGGASGALSQTPLTVSQAVAKAGGPTRTAKASRSVVVRFNPDGSRTELEVDLTKVFRGRSPDLLIKPDDIIFVPGSGAKSFGYSFLRIFPGMVAGKLVYR